jgi:hypothetical protein
MVSQSKTLAATYGLTVHNVTWEAHSLQNNELQIIGNAHGKHFTHFHRPSAPRHGPLHKSPHHPPSQTYQQTPPQSRTSNYG